MSNFQNISLSIFFNPVKQTVSFSCSSGSRISQRRGRQPSGVGGVAPIYDLANILLKTARKMKEFGPRGGGARFSFRSILSSDKEYWLSKNLFQRLYYRPQQSCEGYVFTGVCLSTQGGAWPGGGGVHGPGGCMVLGVHGPGGAWSRGVGIPACTEADPTRRDSYCCRRYASYWNAFLLFMWYKIGAT